MENGKRSVMRKPPAAAGPSATMAAIREATTVGTLGSRQSTDLYYKQENSRAPARKGHEPQAFLTIGEPAAESIHPKGGIKEMPRIGSHVFVSEPTLNTARKRTVAGAPRSAAAEDTAKGKTAGDGHHGASVGAHSASTLRSSSRFNESFTSFGRINAPGTQRAEAVNAYVHTPFKHDVTCRPPSSRRQVVSPSAGLREATMIATMDMGRVIKGELQKSRQVSPATPAGGDNAPRLLKAHLKPLNSVHVVGPGIEMCCGVQSATPPVLHGSLSDFMQERQAAQVDVRLKSGVRRSAAGHRQMSAGHRQMSADGELTHGSSAMPQMPLQKKEPKRDRSSISLLSRKLGESPAPRNSAEDIRESSGSVTALNERKSDAGSYVAITTTHSRVSSNTRAGSAVEVPVALWEELASVRSHSVAGSMKSAILPLPEGLENLDKGLTFLTEHACAASIPSPGGVTSKTEVITDDPRAVDKVSNSAFGHMPGLTNTTSLELSAYDASSGRHSTGPEARINVDYANKSDRRETAQSSRISLTDFNTSALTLLRAEAANLSADAAETTGHRAHLAVTSLQVSGTVHGQIADVSLRQLSDISWDDAETGRMPEVKDAQKAMSAGVRNPSPCKEFADSSDRMKDDDGDDDNERSYRDYDGQSALLLSVPAHPPSAANAGGETSQTQEPGGTTGSSDDILDNYLSLQEELGATIKELRLLQGCSGNKVENIDGLARKSPSSIQTEGAQSYPIVSACVPETEISMRCAKDSFTAPMARLPLQFLSLGGGGDEDHDNNSAQLLRERRGQGQLDIYRDLFYHGCDYKLSLGSYSACLTRRLAPSSLYELLCARKPTAPQAWQQNCTEHASQYRSPVDIFGHDSGAAFPSETLEAAEKQASNHDGRKCTVSADKTPMDAVYLKIDTLLAPILSKAAESNDRYVPPPACFNINAKAPEGRFYYFTYGMHMNADRLSSCLGQHVDVRLWGLLLGFQLVFNKRGLDEEAGLFPNIEFNPFASVEGCVYLLCESQLPYVDGYHGYPEHYARVVVPVWVVNCLDPENYGVAQFCVPAVTYVAQDVWLNDRPSQDSKRREYSVRQCLKAADLLTSNYKRQLLSMLPG